MGRKSTFTPAAKRDAVMGVLTKRNMVEQTCRELGIFEFRPLAGAGAGGHGSRPGG